MIELIHGDCLDILPTLASGSVDCIVCDLPYGTTACAWDTVIPFDAMWRCIRHVIKPKGAVVLFGSQPFTSALVMSNPQWFKYEWVWEKEKPANIFFKEVQPMKYHENISVFSESGAHNMSAQRMNYYPQMERRNPANKRRNAPRINSVAGIFGAGRHIASKEGSGEGDWIFPSSIQSFTTDRESNLHPTQKPVALMEYLIKTYTNEGEMVLDFTMGSGTTGVAAYKTGRSFIGIESDETYFKIAQKRIAQAQMQPALELSA